MTRVVFAGTPEFARESLRALLDSGIRPLAVLTQPDRPAGRGKKLQASAVKEFAVQRDLPVLQPESLKPAQVVEELVAFKSDLLIVAAYGLLLPQRVLDIPHVACINVHASLLPRWRGAAPIQAAILAGDKQTGISLMQMEAGLDTGPVYASSSIDIGELETAGELHDRLARLGGELLVQQIGNIVSGACKADAQNDSEATYAAKIKSADAELDWQRSAVELQRTVRAYNPVPGAWTTLQGERLKCWRAEAVDGTGEGPGSIVNSGTEGISVACGEGILRITELQRPGRRRITAAELAGQLDLDQAVFG
jgi:methionyl-tRNA formyltransferase